MNESILHMGIRIAYALPATRSRLELSRSSYSYFVLGGSLKLLVLANLNWPLLPLAASCTRFGRWKWTFSHPLANDATLVWVQSCDGSCHASA